MCTLTLAPLLLCSWTGEAGTPDARQLCDLFHPQMLIKRDLSPSMRNMATDSFTLPCLSLYYSGEKVFFLNCLSAKFVAVINEAWIAILSYMSTTGDFFILNAFHFPFGLQEINSGLKKTTYFLDFLRRTFDVCFVFSCWGRKCKQEKGGLMVKICFYWITKK